MNITWDSFSHGCSWKSNTYCSIV